MIAFDLPFPVSTNALFANAKRGGRFTTREYKAWQTEAGWEIKRQLVKPIKGPVAIWYLIDDSRKMDPGNCEKPLTDALVKFGVIEADKPAIVKEIHIVQSKVKGIHVEIRQHMVLG